MFIVKKVNSPTIKEEIVKEVEKNERKVPDKTTSDKYISQNFFDFNS